MANERKKSKERKKKPKNQNHPALIGMKRKKRTLFDEKHQVKNKTNTTKKKVHGFILTKK